MWLPRQYRAFVGIAHGRHTHRFFEKLIAGGFATTDLGAPAHAGRLYHLQYKPWYRLLGGKKSAKRVSRQCKSVGASVSRGVQCQSAHAPPPQLRCQAVVVGRMNRHMAARLVRLVVALGLLLGVVLPSPAAAGVVRLPTSQDIAGSPVPAHGADPVYARSYFGARYYRADLGRFTTIDPVYTWQENLEDPQRWNRYAYARNNPLKHVDPDGRWIETLWDVANVVMGAKSAVDNFRSGKILSGVVDTGGALVDLAAAVVPAVPGGVGTAIKAARAVERVDDALDAKNAISVKGATSSLVEVGAFAGESIAGRSSGRSFTAAERAEVNRIGSTTGCHTCGTKNAGTRSGNFVLDHQPPSALKPNGQPQRLYPQCRNCSREQGLEVARRLKEQQQK